MVVAAAASAAGVGAAPIPFADAALLVPIQIGMLAGISATFGIELSRAFLATLVTAMAGTTGAAFLGRAVVSNLLKFIPGLGSVAGGAIAATTAGALTTTLGEIYIAVLAKLFTASRGDAPSPEDIAREFKARMANRGEESTSGSRTHERTALVYDEDRQAERRRRLSALRAGGGHRAAGDRAAEDFERPDPGRHPARVRGQPPHRGTPPRRRGVRVRTAGDGGHGRGQAPLAAADADAAPPGLALRGGVGGAHRRR